MLLSYLLGVTWSLGYFTGLGRWAQYVFVFFNASAGVFVLVQSVILDHKVRMEASRVFGSKSSTKTTWLSANGKSSSHSRKTTVSGYAWSKRWSRRP